MNPVLYSGKRGHWHLRHSMGYTTEFKRVSTSSEARPRAPHVSHNSLPQIQIQHQDLNALPPHFGPNFTLQPQLAGKYHPNI